MAVAVQANLVPRIPDGGTFLGECFQGMARDEPGGLDVVFFKQLQQTGSPNMTSP